MKITLDIPDGIIAGFFVVDKLTREKMISLHDFERKEKHYE